MTFLVRLAMHPSGSPELSNELLVRDTSIVAKVCYSNCVNEITPSELRNDSSRILSRLERGERFTVVRGRRPTAEVIPAQGRAYQSRAEIAEAVKRLPPLDSAQLRAELDETGDASVPLADD